MRRYKVIKGVRTMIQHPRFSRQPNTLVWWLGASALGLMVLVCLQALPGVDGVRLLIRATARTSLLFFLLAYTAQAATLTWPGAWSLWQRVHRRQWGWLFVTSHTIHAAGILALALMAPDLFNTLAPLGIRITGGLAYVFIWAMGLTSFDRSARWLGPMWWARLHTVGLHYIWLSFLVANGKRIAAQPVYALPALLLIAALCWRIWAARQATRLASSMPA